MKNDEAIKTDIFKYIKGTPLHQAITGVLSKRKRPKSSDKEDILISVLANTCGQVQEAVVNVNIYVKDIQVKNQAEEDTIRLDELCRLALQIFKRNRAYVADGCFYLTLISQSVIEKGEEHVINNRIRYEHLNE